MMAGVRARSCLRGGLLSIFLALVYGAFAVFFGGTLSAQPLKERPALTVHGREIFLRLAMTRDDWRQGLMFERHLAENEGMLFVGDHAEFQTFWMKNTFIPLDMIFIREGSPHSRWIIDSIVENAEPETETPRRSKGRAHHVLEINGGLSKRWGLKAGMELKPNRELLRVTKRG